MTAEGDCLHSLIYTILLGGLSIHGFCYLHRSWNQSPPDAKRQRCFGSQKVQFWLCRGRGAPNPHVLQVSPLVGDKARALGQAQIVKGFVCTAEYVVFQCYEEPLKTLCGATKPSLLETSGTQEGELKGQEPRNSVLGQKLERAGLRQRFQVVLL